MSLLSSFVFAIGLCLVTSFSTYAGAAVVSNEDREQAIRNGRVWVQPTWMKENATGKDFLFDSEFQMSQGPALEKRDEVFAQPEVDCLMTEDSAKKSSGGQTLKFYCELQNLKKVTKPKHDLVKIKYNFSDGEISGELLGTRLFWALGFYADRVYLLDHVNCFGCTGDPFRDKRLDPTTLKSPRVFKQTSVERKLEGKEIEFISESGEKSQGFNFEELMNFVPEDSAAKLKEQTHREALRLLAVFIRHSDNKADNQAVTCLGSKKSKQACDGEVALMIHDLGLTFGGGFREGENGEWIASKSNYIDWNKEKVWDDAKSCRAYLGLSPDGS
ncbi:MAG: hypothetical protein EOP05_19015, partial [Proteobacteria bacterium]